MFCGPHITSYKIFFTQYNNVSANLVYNHLPLSHNFLSSNKNRPALVTLNWIKTLQTFTLNTEIRCFYYRMRVRQVRFVLKQLSQIILIAFKLRINSVSSLVISNYNLQVQTSLSSWTFNHISFCAHLDLYWSINIFYGFDWFEHVYVQLEITVLRVALMRSDPLYESTILSFVPQEMHS